MVNNEYNNPFNQRKGPLFDDGFDPMALEISDDEKRRIAKGLNKSKNDIKKEIAAKARHSVKKRDQKIKKEKVGFWKGLLLFFVKLFTGKNRAEHEKIRQLKKIKRQLAKLKPPICNVNRNTISGNFARLVFKVAQTILPFKDVFDKMFSKKGRGDFDFQLFFVQLLSDDNLNQNYNLFEENSIVEMIENEEEIDVRKKLDDAISALKASFSEENKLAVNSMYMGLIDFSDLLNFDYTSFLRKFNSNFRLDNIGAAFKEIRPEGTLKFINKFLSAIYQLNLKELPQILNISKQFYETTVMAHLEKNDTSISMRVMSNLAKDNYRDVLKSILAIIKGHNTILMMKYLKKDIDYELDVIPGHVNFFADFENNMNITIEARLERALEHKNVREKHEKIHLLFGGEEISSDTIISDSMNTRLGKLNLPQFLFPNALDFCIKFLEERFFGYQRVWVNKLLIDGSFRNSAVRRTLSDEFYHFDELLTGLNSFYDSIGPMGDVGEKFIRMLGTYKGGLPSKKAISTRVMELNEESAGFLRDVKESVQKYKVAIDKVCTDIGADFLETIDNLEKIDKKSGDIFIENIKKVQKEAAAFVDLLLDFYNAD